MTTKEIYDLIGSQKDKSNQDLILKTVEDNMDIIDHDIDYNNEETVFSRSYSFDNFY